MPQDIIEDEKDIARRQSKASLRISSTKLLKARSIAYYDANCLIKQKYIRDDSITIADLVNKRAKETGKPLALAGFIYWSVGQG